MCLFVRLLADSEQPFSLPGKKRLWVITAPSHNDHYLRMMEKQLEDMEQVLCVQIYTPNWFRGRFYPICFLFFFPFFLVSLSFRLFRCHSQKGLNCRLAERDTFIITIIQNAMMEGRIQKTTLQGDATVESLDPDTVTKLLHYLELTGQVGHIPGRYEQVAAYMYFFQFSKKFQVFLSVYLCLTCYCLITPVVSGAGFHHAGRKEEPSRQWALPHSSPCWGDFGGHRSVPHEEAGEDDQKRISAEVRLYHQVH